MKKKIILFGVIAVIALAAAGLIYASSELNKKEELENSYLIELTFDELQKKIDNKDSFNSNKLFSLYRIKTYIKKSIGRI